MKATALRNLTLLACLLAFSTAASAQSVTELKAQLAAQKRINELLKQRIRTLEAQVSTGKAATGKSDRVAALTAKADRAVEPQADDLEENRALERALVRRGRAVLPPNTIEITPGFSWSHSGSGGSSSDRYSAALDARIGLAGGWMPGGWMIGARMPFIHRSTSAFGDNTGSGDPSLAVWKELLVQDGTWPSLVASAQYSAPLGDDFTESAVALGSGFHRLSARLAAVKSIDPIAFYASASYTHSFDRKISGTKLDPGGIFGLGAGATLAVTPDVSLNAGLHFAFSEHTKSNGVKLNGSDTTVGVVNLGASVIMTKDLFVNVTSAIGVTDDSPDITVGVSLPYRF